MSREIIDIMADVVKTASQELSIVIVDYYGNSETLENPELCYKFGSAMYFKEFVDEASRVGKLKFPIVMLFSPFKETRDSHKHYTAAKVGLLIATGSSKEWNNEEREVMSFENILRPIYRRLIDALKADRRLDFGYHGIVKHEYSENYSYGRYGAYDSSGEAISEPIDAINIRNLELTVKLPKCR